MTDQNKDPRAQFDVLNVPLSGINLIEASAGTGKTWTITGLFVRLLLERQLNVDQILVVTYTKAATAELRDRIRTRLCDVQQALKSGASEDPFCQDLIRKFPQPSDRALLFRRLDRAIRGFDEAAVYTIHGFCQRVLSDSPFESGIEFEFELMPDESELINEITEDFWRIEISNASGTWADFLLNLNITPENLALSIRAYTGKPYLKIIPSIQIEESKHSEQCALEQFNGAGALWRQDRDAIASLLLDTPVLNRNKYRVNSITKWCRELDVFFASQSMVTHWPEHLEKFTTHGLQGGCKKGLTLPEHVFFAHCQSLLESLRALEHHYTEKWVDTQIRLLNYVNRELHTRKLDLQQISYNDLLNRLDQALSAKHGNNLARTIRNRFRAALIDEFQDTDPIQYNIFKSIYFGHSSPVVFVGDPKQAIYGFRGADVFSYLQARQAASNIYSLKTNRRSAPLLIDAINTLFARSPNPFITQDIEYPMALAAEQSDNALSVTDDFLAPFRFLRLPTALQVGQPSKPLNKKDNTAMACQITGNEIAALLNQSKQGQASLTIDGHCRPVHGGDIAILVGTHRQAESIQQELSSRNIPSVRHGQESVFHTGEAHELYCVLQAVINPTYDAMIKAALITELIGFTANQINQLQNDSKIWERHSNSFRYLNDVWHRQGFIAMFRRWFDTFQIALKLANFQDAERRITNLLHLAELLQIADQDHPECDALLDWLAHHIDSPYNGDESTLLRLESDAERTKIVTIHSSKGLEYPIVFCPFLWDSSLASNRADGVSFHDPDDNYRSVLDLGSDRIDLHKKWASEENLAENLRLLYVGLTRAKYRCYVVWGALPARRDTLAASPLAWLLHGPDQIVDEPLDEMRKITRDLEHQAIDQALKDLENSAPKAISLIKTELAMTKFEDTPSRAQQLSCAHFDRASLEPAWKMNSYSGLTSGLHSETPDYDPIDRETDGQHENDISIFSFPRGSSAGTCLHSILESWDFRSSDHLLLQELVQHQLYAHGIATIWTQTILDTVLILLNKPLGTDRIKLAELDLSQRLVELEFCFPLKKFSLRKLQEILAAPSSQLPKKFITASQGLNFDRFNGYLKGYIDLVFESNKRFYVIDYKSNWLGNDTIDYAPELLTVPMAQHHYYIQYLLYCVALHRYLRSRIPNYSYQQHFGGVLYLFLRGINPIDSNGIYETRPSAALIRQLDDLMDGK